MTFVPPDINTRSFTCPHCGVLARQYKWGYVGDGPASPINESNVFTAKIRIARCEHCGDNCVWVTDTLVYPDLGNAPPANQDMPSAVRGDYEEAGRVYVKSPRGAAALLRLAIQKLMIHLGQPGTNINDDIAALVAAGLPVQIQQALDVVRVTGNNAVHPGQIDVNDATTAEQLFPLVNVIVESQISVPTRIKEMYGSLPEGARSVIAKRDTPR